MHVLSGKSDFQTLRLVKMDIAYLAAITWPAPQDIPAIYDDDDEPLWPLEGPLMVLPGLQAHELGLVPQVQGLFDSNFFLSAFIS